MKRPAFQFYPAEWRKDNELRSSSIGARGLWMELCCVMHDCEPYGHLTAKTGGVMPDEAAAQLCGVERRDYRRLLAELEANGVPSRTADGVLYSRRMVRDEVLRNVRAYAGSKGGNPVLLGQKVNQNLTTKVKQIPTPSSSSSSSSKSEVETTPTVIARATGSHFAIAKNPDPKANGNPDSGQDWDDPKWVAATGEMLGKQRHPNESEADHRDRVYGALGEHMRAAEAEAKKHERS